VSGSDTSFLKYGPGGFRYASFQPWMAFLGSEADQIPFQGLFFSKSEKGVGIEGIWSASDPKKPIRAGSLRNEIAPAPVDARAISPRNSLSAKPRCTLWFHPRKPLRVGG